jgi:hypothetical protein
MYDYHWIKALAKEHKLNIRDLLALSPNNDPFYTGRKSTRQQAEWFAGLWDQFGYTTGVPLRRIHYQLVSQAAAQKPDGTPYENTENDWQYLCCAGKYARDLDLVSPDAFVDRRNPEPHIYHYAARLEDPTIEKNLEPWPLPSINTSIEFDKWEWPTIEYYGYDYLEGHQPVLIEIWAEKSTMDDILDPLCQRYAINLVTGLGFMSDVSFTRLIKNRIIAADKPCRVLYISDYDPAGAGMPIAAARRIEFKSYKATPRPDIKLTPIVLTREQVIQYQLPRMPVKDTDLRKPGWEALHGEGAVELDALEALHPGELARIVRGYIHQCRDNGLRQKMWRAAGDASDVTDQFIETLVEQHRDARADLRARIEAMMESYQTELEELGQRFARDIEQFKPEVESLWHAIQNDLEQLDSGDLPGVPDPELPKDTTEWLFDSTRDYFTQLSFYKNQINGEGKEPSNGSV